MLCFLKWHYFIKLVMKNSFGSNQYIFFRLRNNALNLVSLELLNSFCIGSDKFSSMTISLMSMVSIFETKAYDDILNLESFESLPLVRYLVWHFQWGGLLKFSILWVNFDEFVFLSHICHYFLWKVFSIFIHNHQTIPLQ